MIYSTEPISRFRGDCGMIDKADAIVIGSGGLGAATAYYLSKRSGLSVALLDKHEIGSPTSPRAAGMVSCLRKGDLMISLIKDACRKIEAFTDCTVRSSYPSQFRRGRS